jgi:hypothetical protein
MIFSAMIAIANVSILDHFRELLSTDHDAVLHLHGDNRLHDSGIWTILGICYWW